MDNNPFKTIAESMSIEQVKAYLAGVSANEGAEFIEFDYDLEMYIDWAHQAIGSCDLIEREFLVEQWNSIVKRFG